MSLNSSTYPNVTDNSSKEKAYRNVAEIFNQIGTRLIDRQASSPTTDEKRSKHAIGQRRQHQGSLALDAQQERQERCRQIGQILRQTRQERSLSVQWLFNRTYIPAHQIQALEEGRLGDLPEDIYLRGFIRQLGNALGLNGSELAAQLPIENAAVVPTWYRSESSGSFQISSVHLYLGYATLLIGAVGGLSWLSEQTLPEASRSRPEVSFEQLGNRAPDLQSSPAMTAANIAPPERL